jgi:hypothetical protein
MKTEDKKTPVTAEALYEAYRARKQQNTALPQPAFHQLDELERLSWEETAKVVSP